jgi:hypothetical protein
MKRSRILTLKTIIEAGTCSDQVNLFKAMFGEKVEVTISLCKKVATEYDWNWAAVHFLSSQAYKIYIKATEYARKIYFNTEGQQAWEDYKMTTASAWAKCYIEDKK